MILTKGGYDIIRNKFGKLKQSQIDGFNSIVSAIDKHKYISYPQAAYMLATAWHETAGTMQPIEEYSQGKNKTYGTWYKNSNGELYSFMDGSKRAAYLYSTFPHLYYGRGYVQLTWYANYKKASEKLDVDFVHKPELAMDANHAANIMILGMNDGWFTGKRLDDYINATKKDYINARRIINGMDKAELIAGYAETFEKALRSL